jgi:hypothetical protein
MQKANAFFIIAIFNLNLNAQNIDIGSLATPAQLDADDISGWILPRSERDLHFENSSHHLKSGVSLLSSGQGAVDLPACSTREI